MRCALCGRKLSEEDGYVEHASMHHGIRWAWHIECYDHDPMASREIDWVERCKAIEARGDDRIGPIASQSCMHCGEPLDATRDDDPFKGSFDPVWDGVKARIMHRACMIRRVVGSVAHQMGECSCYGDAEESEPGSRRDAAIRAAAVFWARKDPSVLPS